MAFHYLTNIPLEKAREDYCAALLSKGYAAGTERVTTPESGGRVTAEAVYAAICAPHYPASAMDGIALQASLTFGAGETTPVSLQPDQFIMVDTGDPIPEGCDAVVMIEDVIFQEDGSVALQLHIAVDQGVNITALAHSIMGEVSYKVNKATGIPVSSVDVFVDSMLIG